MKCLFKKIFFFQFLKVFFLNIIYRKLWETRKKENVGREGMRENMGTEARERGRKVFCFLFIILFVIALKTC